MHCKLLLLFLPGLCFLLITTSLYLGREHLTRLSNLHLPIKYKAVPVKASLSPSPTTIATNQTLEQVTVATARAIASPSTTRATPTPTAITVSNGAVLDAERIHTYVSAILTPDATHVPRLKCPALDISRYKALRKQQEARQESQQIDYFFALNLRDCVNLLPRLLGSIVEAIRFLGPHRCALSIVEGNSPDGTADVLDALRPFLDDTGITYFYNSSEINPANGARIHKLAQLRNLALAPLYHGHVNVTEETTVVFVNDVAACPEDLLELVLQRRNLNADMTCAMDWTFVGPDPTFYDIWIARTIHGDSFFEVGSDGNWNSAWNLFWNAPDTKARYDARLPFQVFACWNGAVTFTAAPLLHGLRFRDVRSDKKECYQGEPQLFCKDLWSRGYRKIAVVPTVNLEYSDERGADIKKLKGYVSERVKTDEKDEDRDQIDWKFDAPEQVRCMPDWEHQSWRPWNETLQR